MLTHLACNKDHKLGRSRADEEDEAVILSIGSALDQNLHHHYHPPIKKWIRKHTHSLPHNFTCRGMNELIIDTKSKYLLIAWISLLKINNNTLIS